MSSISYPSSIYDDKPVIKISIKNNPFNIESVIVKAKVLLISNAN